jgi:hypothetical protein
MTVNINGLSTNLEKTLGDFRNGKDTMSTSVIADNYFS